jgi:hypothetical protein
MAVAVLGGLLTVAFTTMFLLPALYQHLASPDQQGVVTTEEEGLDREIVLPKEAATAVWPRQRDATADVGEETVK